jgi:hypothetical protein
MPKFDPIYTLVTDVQKCRTIDSVDHFNLEIAAALVNDVIEDISTEEQSQMNIYIQGDLKKLGEGLTCSNFRKKEDSHTNNIVVTNMMKVMMIDRPKVMTSYPRAQRTISVNLDGLEKYGKEMIVFNNKVYDDTKTQMLHKFLEYYNLEITNIRKFCEGARYNTYLADCMSFILMMLHTMGQGDIFELQYQEPHIVSGCDMSPVETGERIWNPDREHTYLYHKDTDEMNDVYKYLVPKKESIDMIYTGMFKLFVIGEDNHFKTMTRKFLQNTCYYRWSDFWINDIDDGITIFMIRNAYEGVDLSDKDILIRDQLDDIIEDL